MGTVIFLTASLFFKIELFCTEDYFYLVDDCKNELSQCLGDDVFTFDECAKEYKLELEWN